MEPQSQKTVDEVLPAFVPLGTVPAQAEPLPAFLAKAGRLPVLQGLALVVQMLSTLAAAHARGEVHGALSTGSLFVTGSGRVGVIEPDASLEVPMACRPPEQIEGGVVDARSDLYCAAIVAYELLTGTLPSQGNGARASWPARSARRDLPAGIESVFHKALAQDPALRFSSAQELSLALQAAVGSPDWNHATRIPPRQLRVQAQRPVSAHRSRRAGWLAGAVTAAAVLLVVAAGVGESRAPERIALNSPTPVVAPARVEAPVAAAVPVAVPLPAPVAVRAPAAQAETLNRSRAEPVEEFIDPAPVVSAAPSQVEKPAVVLHPVRAEPAARPAAATRPARRDVTASVPSPAAQCPRDSLGRDLCLALQCATADFRAHPICGRMHAEARASSRLAELRGAP